MRLLSAPDLEIEVHRGGVAVGRGQAPGQDSERERAQERDQERDQDSERGRDQDSERERAQGREPGREGGSDQGREPGFEPVQEADFGQVRWPVDADARSAVVEYDGAAAAVDPDLLLVNLPDVMPEASYDIVYSYSSTSACAGIAIPGVTGMRLEGYVEGEQDSAYWATRRFVVPCAYRTALKARAVAADLLARGYRLLVYDAYRPMTAQYYLSDAFERAYASDPAIREGVGGWSTIWYVASGPSGHNYGTDLDVGVCDLDGNLLAMPSSFDAFDEGGHLTYSPIDSASIDAWSYRDAVRGNAACMALHEAFTSAGFSELASEWWHFGDNATESANRALIGPAGLDFIARM